MKFAIDLLTRYQAAFGVVGSRFHYADGTIQASASINVNRFSPPAALSAQGKQNRFASPALYSTNNYCFADMELVCGDFSIALGQFDHSIRTADSTAFIAPPMISLSREKVINVSKPDRGEGEVVENFSKRSWEIEIKGLIVDMENHVYPSTQVRKLRQFFDIDDVFDVAQCPLLSDVGIKALYLTDFSDLSGVEGFQDTLSYTFKARSFQPVAFQLYGK